MTHRTLGAMLVSDLIQGTANPWENVYDPSRMSTFSVKESMPEIIDSTVPYADWLKSGDVSTVGEIEPGKGAIIRDGLSKIAVYRDVNGILHKRSAVCKHLGCVVRFNRDETTWTAHVTARVTESTDTSLTARQCPRLTPRIRAIIFQIFASIDLPPAR